jgi:hypothetical protein
MDIVVTSVDLIVQLMICYICWTIGSNIKFRSFHLKIVRTNMSNSLMLQYSTLDSNEEMSVYIESTSEIAIS